MVVSLEYPRRYYHKECAERPEFNIIIVIRFCSKLSYSGFTFAADTLDIASSSLIDLSLVLFFVYSRYSSNSFEEWTKTLYYIVCFAKWSSGQQLNSTFL